MSRKKTKELPIATREAAKAPAPGLWDSRIRPFLEKRALLIAICCMAVGSLRIVATYSQLGLTYDEPQHLACGLEYLAQHVYRYETQHPPLARAMTAVLPYLDGARPSGNPDRENEGVGLAHPLRESRSLSDPDARRDPALLSPGVPGRLFLDPPHLRQPGSRACHPAVYARAAGAGARRPRHYRHGPRRLPGRWPSSRSSCGPKRLPGRDPYSWAWQALPAALSKFTALGFFPAGAVLALLAWLVVARPGGAQLAQLAKERAPGLLLAAATCVLTIWAAYFFSFGPMPGGGASMPAPEFFDGIRTALRHNSEGHPSYLLGRNGTTGWWYYFPVALGGQDADRVSPSA